ncbi:hypothetical protein [Deinococcus geothermalis]|uniref:hypothetical protein n=1 Tax=Deinococcus geothermalis TaxID=68909 RepID=UPI0023538E31|nr:hypothetical protein [Deinococcus geothermalis]
MAYHLNYERAAAILVDAAYLGDEEAAKKWKITVRTIYNYRERLKTDPKLSDLFRQKRAAAEGDWRSELKRALTRTLGKATLIVECIEPVIVVETELGQEQQVNMPALRTLIAAGKDLGELALALEVLNAGDTQPDARPPAAGAGVANRPDLPN